MKKLFTWIVVVLVHLAVAKGTLVLATLSGGPAPLWPALGFGVASALLFGRALTIPAVFLSAILTSLSIAVPVKAALTIACGSSLETFAFATLLLRVPASRSSGHEGLQQFLGYAVVAAVGATIGATFGTFAMYRLARAPIIDWSASWSLWWAGDALGVLAVTPVVLSLAAAQRRSVGWLAKAAAFS